MKSVALAIAFAGILIVGAFVFSESGGGSDWENGGGSLENANANNVSVVDGKQIIEIRAKGGYQPRVSTARAGLPTILRFNTAGTFDCSSSVRIPNLGISKILPQSGATDIDLGNPTLGTLVGSCGMGMYPFEIEFES
ncbi:MAG TPA: cupredoxin domain-containing protein [Candidatus Paceibacterota bacterium]